MNWELVGQYLPGIAALLVVLLNARSMWSQLKREPTEREQKEIDLQRMKEEAADRLAVRNYQWYDGTSASQIKMVEWLREQLELERVDRQAAVKREREARLAAEAECELRIKKLKEEIDRMKSKQ